MTSRAPRRGGWHWPALLGTAAAVASVPLATNTAMGETAAPPTSYMPVVITEDFDSVVKRMSAAKPGLARKHADLLNERYDLANRPSPGATMTKGKALQDGVRVRLPRGVTWDQLAAMSPDDIKAKDLFPKGFLPLPHPNHPEGGMVFPKFHIDEIRRQEIDRDLTRFDLDYDLPDHFLPEFPAPIFLTTCSFNSSA